MSRNESAEDANTNPDRDPFPPIADYAPIGDCRTLALVSRTAAIEWWCQPRFDADSMFAAILDRRKGGTWRFEGEAVTPLDRRYLPHTAILETRLRVGDSTIAVMDFLALVGRQRQGLGPAPFARQKLVRLVRCEAGSAAVALRLEPRPDYGARRPRLLLAGPQGQRRRTLAVAAGGERRRVLFSATLPWGPIRDAGASLRATLSAGEEFGVVIDYGPGDLEGEQVGVGAQREASEERTRPVELDELHRWRDETAGFWRSWTAVSNYRGPHEELVERSAITLKLLTYHPTGAIVAAGTTSLPEQIGGSRNWDYRFTWLRDASFTLYALHQLGYRAEADAYMAWMQRAGSSHAGPLVLYRVDGNPPLSERQRPQLTGYRGSRPVRIGNAATWQRQLDIYGETLDAAYLDVRSGSQLSAEEWERFSGYADMASERWRLPDTSIWEVRGGRRHFTYSKVMCWVAVDRAVRLAEMLGRAESERERMDRWRTAAREIREAVMARGRRGDGAFVQTFGSDVIDASALVFPLVGFIRADARASEATLRAVQRELAHDGLVLRYRPDRAVDGLEGAEAAFLICSFWLVDNLALRGELDEARRLFDRLAAHANDLGIFSEEWDATTHEALGNVPQAFTHIALISSAHNLQRAARGEMHGRVRRDALGD
jgi:GH15 family glucan-1,4-alpha-glucosidase